jgi:hypothetical protein
MTVTESKEQREGKEKKIGTKPNLTTIYAPLKKKNDKTIQMMLWHHNYHHCSQPYALSKYDGEANTLTCTRHVSTTFYLYKNKNTPGAKQ